MTARLTVPLSVIVVRDTNEHPWDGYRWRTDRVVLDPLGRAGWDRWLGWRGRRTHSEVAELVLDPGDTISYRVNLANGEPSVYVVLRQDGRTKLSKGVVRSVTASPFEARARSDPALDWVDRVAMPARLVTLLEGFVAGRPASDTDADHAGRPASDLLFGHRALGFED